MFTNVYISNCKMSEKRATNFIQSEIDLLLQLVHANKHVIEGGRTGEHLKDRRQCWKMIEKIFNGKSTYAYRDVKVLKQKYENLKKRKKSNGVCVDFVKEEYEEEEEEEERCDYEYTGIKDMETSPKLSFTHVAEDENNVVDDIAILTPVPPSTRKRKLSSTSTVNDHCSELAAKESLLDLQVEHKLAEIEHMRALHTLVLKEHELDIKIKEATLTKLNLEIEAIKTKMRLSY